MLTCLNKFSSQSRVLFSLQQHTTEPLSSFLLWLVLISKISIPITIDWTLGIILRIFYQPQIKTIDFNDTFLSFDHLRHSFPRYDVKVDTSIDDSDVKPTLLPPFRVTFNEGSETEKPSLAVESVVKASRGPYPFNAPKKNNIPFTPTQVEAVRSGINPGLTLIVGPPGNYLFL